jgi:hypothetical protein
MARAWWVLLAIGLPDADAAAAQALDERALAQITDTAAKLCGEFAREGFRNSSAIEGTARAELQGLAGRLVDLGVEGAGKIESSDYANVLQEQLGEELKNQRECNLKIWNDLRTLLTAPGQGAAPRPEPAIDISGTWSYVAVYPGGVVYGEIEVARAGGNSFEGVIRNSLGYSGHVRSTVSGLNVTSEMLWNDASRTTSAGVLTADGGAWSGQDSTGCSAEATRG